MPPLWSESRSTTLADNRYKDAAICWSTPLNSSFHSTARTAIERPSIPRSSTMKSAVCLSVGLLALCAGASAACANSKVSINDPVLITAGEQPIAWGTYINNVGGPNDACISVTDVRRTLWFNTKDLDCSRGTIPQIARSVSIGSGIRLPQACNSASR
ncbi:uncharacterized protein BJ171DRAFT_599839 [Polychytrium aggregatum]|uniref:uncharacterized protein n=1 Tax=Polychytrium aggregatum TaxID=110093 RepID=UPI0022FEC990|nr:uncharacterized protein BJ171DRAFT_599839 [Polychytrium aggregatum]KAI9203601.1 hypothetical protein BJ171DRAFT_599839 [Polychytrium aggregatum]